MKLEANATHVAATVEFRTHAEFLKGPAKGKGFEWVSVEAENNASAIFAAATRKAVKFGLMDQATADSASMLVIEYTAQWGSDGKAVGNWRG